MGEDHFWSWLAGFIDGEGTIGFWLQKQYRKCGREKHRMYERYMPVITISNTSKETLDFIAKRIGGTVRKGAVKNKPEKWKQNYLYLITANGCRKIIPKIMPFLQIKNRQARLIIEYLSLTNDKNVTKVVEGNFITFTGKVCKKRNILIPNPNKQEMLQIVEKVKILNKKGVEVNNMPEENYMNKPYCLENQ
jgi:hypothetical protein